MVNRVWYIVRTSCVQRAFSVRSSCVYRVVCYLLRSRVCTIKGMLIIHGYPSAIIIHCAGNDIGDVPLGLLLYNMKQTFLSLIVDILPGIPIIWSSILPRITWRYSSSSNKMERTRKRVNRAIRSFLLKRNCYIIKYPDFDDKLQGLFANDGVHLSFIGLDLFINTIQGAVETFIVNPWYHIYPLAV